jgi:hypothetical protein
LTYCLDRASPSKPFLGYNISESTVFVEACQYQFPQILILMMILGDIGLDFERVIIFQPN